MVGPPADRVLDEPLEPHAGADHGVGGPMADGSEDVLRDCPPSSCSLTDAGRIEHTFGHGRGGYLYLIDGRLSLNGDSLATGDAAKVTGEATLELSTDVAAELILIDVTLQFEPVGVWVRGALPLANATS